MGNRLPYVKGEIIMEKIRVGESLFGFVADYSKIDNIRKSFNNLTSNIYGFDFEKWYRNGYWKDRYIPYSIVDEGKVISNVSVNPIDFIVSGERKRFVQIGTVMTDDNYRGMGLNKYLLERVINDYGPICSMIYLYANDSVLDYYTKFGFKRTTEYECVLEADGLVGINNRTSYSKLDVTVFKDRLLMEKVLAKRKSFSKLAMLNNDSLIMFYSTYFMSDKLYYIEDIDTVVVMDKVDGILNLYEVIGSEGDLDRVLREIVDDSVREVRFGFTPLDCENMIIRERTDDVLFVYEGKGDFLTEDKLMFPVLSQT